MAGVMYRMDNYAADTANLKIYHKYKFRAGPTHSMVFEVMFRVSTCIASYTTCAKCDMPQGEDVRLHTTR